MGPEDVRKSILLIKSQPKSVAAVESFLRNREWKIHSTTGMKEALTYLVAHKPSFVLISVDHPNKKVRMLPKLLAQSFPVFVMVFSETNSSAGYKNLLASGCNYRINPPMTGPAVERMINKILRDQEEEKERAKNPRSTANVAAAKGNQPAGPVGVIAGSEGAGSPSDGGPVHLQGQAPDAGMVGSAADLLRQMSENDSDQDDDSALGGFLAGLAKSAEKDGPAYAGGGREAARLGGAVPASTDGDSELRYPDGLPVRRGASGRPLRRRADGSFDENDELSEAEAEQLEGSLRAAEQTQSSIESDSVPSAEPMVPQGRSWRSEPEDAPEPETPIVPGELATKKAGRRAGETHADLSTDGVTEAGILKPHDQKKGEGGELPDAEEHGGAASLRREVHKVRSRANSTPGEANVMMRGTQAALDQSVVRGDGIVREELQRSTNVACLIIESPKFSGYLVAALGKNRKLDEDFVKVINDRLIKFLRDNGEQANDEGSMGLRIKPVDFEGWALEYAEFLRKSVHNGEEIAMAFFPFAAAKTEFEESASVDMGAVRIDELRGDLRVEFNLYIYLPANKKYILYTPKGGTFYSNQKGRLAEMGVKHLHVKRAELQDVSRYRAQNYLNEKIEDYEGQTVARSQRKSG